MKGSAGNVQVRRAEEYSVYTIPNRADRAAGIVVREESSSKWAGVRVGVQFGRDCDADDADRSGRTLMEGRPISIAGVNITHVVVNAHGPIFAELIELLFDSLERLGISVAVKTNRLVADRLNLLVGHTAFLSTADFAAVQATGASYVVFQAEALDEAVGFAPGRPAYINFLATARQIWDYSPTNLPFLAQRGCQDVRHIPLGYAARLERIAPTSDREIDVLFYGVVSPRRRRVLETLWARGFRVEVLFGTYGPARDREIARAKVVLNVHQFGAPHLEVIRLAYLLNNRCFVVSETSDRDPYEGGVVFCDYGGLADCCAAFVGPRMESERNEIAGAGYTALKKISTVEGVRSALAAINPEPASNRQRT